MKVMKPVLLTTALLTLSLFADAASELAVPLDLSPVTFLQRPAVEPVVIVKDGQPAGKIAVMTDEMPENEAKTRPLWTLKTVAAELQTVIELSTGVKMELQYNKLDDAVIVIGPCELARENGVDADALPNEGFMIKTVPGRILIVGNARPVGSPVPPGADGLGATYYSQGTAWGVAEFMERFLGVRWYWPTAHGGRSVIKQNSVTVAPVWLQDAPVYHVRTTFPFWFRDNLHSFLACLRFGGVTEARGRGHVPLWDRVQGFKEEHPECFQMRSDGGRDFSMLCYSHPKTLEKYVEQMAEVWDKGNSELNFNEKLISPVYGDYVVVGPNDASIACKCERCSQMYDHDGGVYGKASPIIDSFITRLAGIMSRRWPDKKIFAQRYVNYTLASDALQRHEIPIYYDVCGMPGIAQYKEPAIRKQFVDNINRYMQATSIKGQTYEYSCWPQDRTKVPFQFPHLLKDYYQQLKGQISGSFVDAAGQDDWQRQHITRYCWVKLLWNPEFNVDAMIAEYCRRMYGPAAGQVHELVRLQTDGWENSRWPSGRFNLKELYETSYPKDTVDRMKTLLAEAEEQAAADPEAATRLKYFAAVMLPFFEEADMAHGGTGLKNIVAQKVGSMPVIDGKLDDEAWHLGEWSEPFELKEEKGTKPAQHTTRLKAVWDLNGGVVFAFHCKEPNLKNRLKLYGNDKDNGSAWWDDCVEMFIDPTQDGVGPYLHFILSAGGGTFDGQGTDNPYNPDLSYDAAAKGMKWAQHEGDGFWTLEIFFPWDSLPNAWKPATGVEWRGNFTRHRMVQTDMNLTDPHEIHKKGSEGEFSRLNARAGGASANPANFGLIKFVE